MNKRLLARIEKLEALVMPPRIGPLLLCAVTQLPDDYVGERHRVLLSRTPRSEGGQLLEWEERPGAGPDEPGLAQEYSGYTVPPLIIWLTRGPMSEGTAAEQKADGGATQVETIETSLAIDDSM